MYRLTREQKLANLREIFNQKYQKYKNLEKELQDLQAKIRKFESSPEPQTSTAQTQQVNPETVARTPGVKTLEYDQH